MRTREEQIESACEQIKQARTSNNVCNWLSGHILEAERRGYERAKAECAADTRRLEWLAASLIDMRINRTRRTVIISGPMTAFDFRQSIDITQKGGK